MQSFFSRYGDQILSSGITVSGVSTYNVSTGIKYSFWGKVADTGSDFFLKNISEQEMEMAKTSKDGFFQKIVQNPPESSHPHTLVIILYSQPWNGFIIYQFPVYTLSVNEVKNKTPSFLKIVSDKSVIVRVEDKIKFISVFTEVFKVDFFQSLFIYSIFLFLLLIYINKAKKVGSLFMKGELENASKYRFIFPNLMELFELNKLVEEEIRKLASSKNDIDSIKRLSDEKEKLETMYNNQLTIFIKSKKILDVFFAQLWHRSLFLGESVTKNTYQLLKNLEQKQLSQFDEKRIMEELVTYSNAIFTPSLKLASDFDLYHCFNKILDFIAYDLYTNQIKLSSNIESIKNVRIFSDDIFFSAFFLFSIQSVLYKKSTINLNFIQNHKEGVICLEVTIKCFGLTLSDLKDIRAISENADSIFKKMFVDSAIIDKVGKKLNIEKNELPDKVGYLFSFPTKWTDEQDKNDPDDSSHGSNVIRLYS